MFMNDAVKTSYFKTVRLKVGLTKPLLLNKKPVLTLV